MFADYVLQVHFKVHKVRSRSRWRAL